MRTSLIALAAAATLATGIAQAEPANYAIDPTHTFVTFEISHFGASVNRGRFDKKEGSVQLDKAAKAGKVEISFDTTSINSGTPAFDKHLQSADLFNAVQRAGFLAEAPGNYGRSQPAREIPSQASTGPTGTGNSANGTSPSSSSTQTVSASV